MLGSPVCKHNSVSLILPETNSLIWEGFQVGQSLVDCSLNLCSIFITTHPVGMMNLELKVLWMG